MSRLPITQLKSLVNTLNPQKPLKTLSCPICKKRFRQRRWWQKNCSNKCTDRAYKIRTLNRLREEIRQELLREGNLDQQPTEAEGKSAEDGE